MRNLIIGLILGTSVSVLTSTELTLEQRQRANLYQLKLQLAQCQLGREQTELLDEFKLTLSPTEGQEFDWSSLTYKSKDTK